MPNVVGWSAKKNAGSGVLKRVALLLGTTRNPNPCNLHRRSQWLRSSLRPLLDTRASGTQEQETTLQHPTPCELLASIKRIYEKKASGASLERRHVLKINWNGPLFGNAPSPGKKQQLPVVRGLAVGAL